VSGVLSVWDVSGVLSMWDVSGVLSLWDVFGVLSVWDVSGVFNRWDLASHTAGVRQYYLFNLTSNFFHYGYSSPLLHN
jgi:hypothetical protein